MQDLNGKHALVTGASSGIGRAIAVALAREGVRLALTGRNAEGLENTAAEIHAENPGCELTTHTADLTSDAEVRALCDTIAHDGDCVEILVHVAGIAPLGDVAEASADTLRETLAINTVAPYTLTQCLLPDLIQTRGSVVFINSRAAFKPLRGLSHYCASKAALRSIADALRQEMAPLGVRVMSVYPGKIATPMQEEIQSSRGKVYDPGDYPAPESVADTVVCGLRLPADTVLADIVVQPTSETT